MQKCKRAYDREGRRLLVDIMLTFDRCIMYCGPPGCIIRFHFSYRLDLMSSFWVYVRLCRFMASECSDGLNSPHSRPGADFWHRNCMSCLCLAWFGSLAVMFDRWSDRILAECGNPTISSSINRYLWLILTPQSFLPNVPYCRSGFLRARCILRTLGPSTMLEFDQTTRSRNFPSTWRRHLVRKVHFAACRSPTRSRCGCFADRQRIGRWKRGLFDGDFGTAHLLLNYCRRYDLAHELDGLLVEALSIREDWRSHPCQLDVLPRPRVLVLGDALLRCLRGSFLDFLLFQVGQQSTRGMSDGNTHPL
jgi:hypothetical protein